MRWVDLVDPWYSNSPFSRAFCDGRRVLADTRLGCVGGGEGLRARFEADPIDLRGVDLDAGVVLDARALLAVVARFVAWAEGVCGWPDTDLFLDGGLDCE